MPEFDLAIRGGTVVTAADTLHADIGIRDGRIAAVAEWITDATRTVDASGLLVLPGGVFTALLSDRSGRLSFSASAS